MSLEDITAGHTIANMVITNPAAGDSASQGDDHIRNIKKAVQYTFMNLSATVSSVAAELDLAHKGGTISGALMVKDTLTVSGASVLKSTISIDGGATMAGTLSVSGAAVLKTSLTCEGTATFSATVVAKTAFLNEGTFTQSGAAVFKSGATFEATCSFSATIVGTVLSAGAVNGHVPYAGLVGALGTTGAAVLPAGWTSRISVSGVYVVTHNLGDTSSTAKHFIALTPWLTSGNIVRICAIREAASNYFKYAVGEAGSGSLTAGGVYFHFLRKV